MARKTVKIVDLLDSVNRKNSTSTCSPEVRQGWNAILADVLHENGVYAGFNYYEQDKVPPGHKPGIIRSSNIETEPHLFPDETRRFYYMSSKLR